jgi:DNA-binding phage protein
MAIIVTRETGATAVNRPLTNVELDNNFINLNSDIQSKQPLDADLTAIAALAGTSGLLKKTAADTWALDTSAYLTGIISSDVTGALGFTPESTANKGQANGYASLDSSGLIPSSQLPSYVDDVVEYTNLAGFPAVGSASKIYLAQDTSKIYRWSGSTYIEIAGSPGSTDSVAEGTTNLYFTQARARESISATQNISYNSTTGLLTGPDLSGYLTSATAASTYQTQSGMSSYLTTADAATTYQTQSGMSSYLTTSSAASTYQTQSGMSSYLTTASASSTYQPLDADLTAIAAVTGTSGVLKKTAANTWELDTTITGGGGGSITSSDVTTALGYTPPKLSVSGTAPTSPSNGDLWWNSDSGSLFIYYTDGTSNQWVDVSVPGVVAASGGGGSGTITSTDVTNALGFTPYNATNPSSYITTAGARSAISATQNLTYNSTTGVLTGPDLSGYLTSSTAASTYQTQSGMSSYLTTADAGTTYQTQAGMSSYLTTADAGTTYQTQSGMSAYLTTADAGTTYQTQSGMSSYLTTADAGTTYQTQSGMSAYLTTADAGTTYQTQAGMSSYLTTSSASSTYQPLDADLTAIAALAGTSGMLKKTAANTWALDTTTYLTGITSTDVTTALGFTPYNATNPSNYITTADARSAISATQNLSYNSTTGVLTGPDLSGYLTSATAASTYQTQSGMSSYLTTADAGTTYQTQSGMSSYLTSSTAASTYQPLDADLTAIAALAGTSGILKKTAANTWSLDTSTYLTGITSTDVTTALGFTPYNATNPSNYITTADARSAISATQNITYNSTTGVLTGPDLSGYLTSTTAASTYQTQAGMSSYLTSSTASSTYQTQAGMSSYLTTADAATTYQTQSGMSSYLTSSTASSTYQPLDADLTAIAALSGTSGVLKKTAANTWELDTTITGGGSSGGITTGKAIAMAMIFGG